MNVDINSYIDKIVDLCITYAPKLALAIGVLFLGLYLIGLVEKMFRNALERSKLDATLVPFLSYLLSWTLKLLLFISVASMVGVATTSFVAILGAAGLAVGLALQGSLANFASGILLIVFRPYRVGDLISVGGHTGIVQEVHIFTTKLITPQNQTIIIPNANVTSGAIVNVTSNGILRVDVEIGIGYEDNIKTAKEIIKKVLLQDERILKDKDISIVVCSLGDNSVNLRISSWAKTADYWGVYFYQLENIKLAFDEAGVSIPYPQRDIHIIEQKA